jgi:hypothetical protein
MKFGMEYVLVLKIRPQFFEKKKEKKRKPLKQQKRRTKTEGYPEKNIGTDPETSSG